MVDFILSWCHTMLVYRGKKLRFERDGYSDEISEESN